MMVELNLLISRLTEVEYIAGSRLGLKIMDESLEQQSQKKHMERATEGSAVVHGEPFPQLPDYLSKLDAENCKSLERLDCSFHNPDIALNFRNCFKLNQEARDLIIQTSSRRVILPGGKVPAYFTHRACGSFVTVKLNERPLRTSTKFRACILLDIEGDWEEPWVPCSISIMSKQNALTACSSGSHSLHGILTDHLYTFDVEAKEVTSTELSFEFKVPSDTNARILKIKECGILHLLEDHVDEDYESFSEGDDDSDYESSDEDYD